MTHELLLFYLGLVIVCVFALVLRRGPRKAAKNAGSKGTSASVSESTGESGEVSFSPGDEKVAPRTENSPKNERSFLENPILESLSFPSPNEKENLAKYSRPLVQPLNTSLFEMDKADDLTRPYSNPQRSLNLFTLDKQDDATSEQDDDSASESTFSTNFIDKERNDSLF